MTFWQFITGQEAANLVSVVSGVGVLIGGAFALITYLKNSRREATIWINSLFTHFYTTDSYKLAREAMEYSPEKIYALCKQRNTSPSEPLDEAQSALLISLDAFLNFFENVLYIESQKGFSKTDRDAMFNYWFAHILSGCLKDSHEDAPHFALYLRNGFEFLQNELNKNKASATRKSRRSAV
jgi:hypothetical protein